jgi:hypothetical protein
MRKEDLVPRYKFMDNFVRIHDRLTLNDIEAANLLIEMRDTILYQMEEIRKQRAEIIYVKHKYAWRRYDREENNYDPATRKYKNNDNDNDISKPKKSSNSNPSC